MSIPRRVKIVEVGPRDGLQNEAVTVPAETKVELVEKLADAGFKGLGCFRELTFHKVILLLTTAAGFADESARRVVTKEDMPRIPATEPKDALGTFRLADGFELELVASEPLVSDPVDACFDERDSVLLHGVRILEILRNAM